ncbi:hypothetical protein Taitung257_11210 [Helicobacter pylori]
MTYRELGKKVLEQAERPLSAKEIWERACGMGLDKELSSIKKTPWSTLGSRLGEYEIPDDKKQFYVANNKNPFFIGSNLVKENCLHKKSQTPKKKMVNRASV